MGSRLLRWPAGPAGARPSPTIRSTIWADYDAKLRNQIRQAGRQGIQLSYELPDDTVGATAVYRDFVALHRDSWGRTGLRPHGLRYFVALQRGGGGRRRA